jgi:hypothetical protein
MSRRIFGMPALVVLGGAAVVAYFLFFRGKSSAGGTSSGGGGTAGTGDITFQPGTTTIQVTNPVTNTSGKPPAPNQHHKHRTPNPQPRPKPKPRKKVTSTSVAHKGSPERFVTVATWPGHSVNGVAQWNTTLSGIAKHSNTSVAELLKLNPGIKNPALVYPGEKIRIK